MSPRGNRAGPVPGSCSRFPVIVHSLHGLVGDRFWEPWSRLSPKFNKLDSVCEIFHSTRSTNGPMEAIAQGMEEPVDSGQRSRCPSKGWEVRAQESFPKLSGGPAVHRPWMWMEGERWGWAVGERRGNPGRAELHENLLPKPPSSCFLFRLSSSLVHRETGENNKVTKWGCDQNVGMFLSSQPTSLLCPPSLQLCGAPGWRCTLPGSCSRSRTPWFALSPQVFLPFIRGTRPPVYWWHFPDSLATRLCCGWPRGIWVGRWGQLPLHLLLRKLLVLEFLSSSSLRVGRWTWQQPDEGMLRPQMQEPRYLQACMELVDLPTNIRILCLPWDCHVNTVLSSLSFFGASMMWQFKLYPNSVVLRVWFSDQHRHWHHLGMC